MLQIQLTKLNLTFFKIERNLILALQIKKRSNFRKNYKNGKK